MPTQTNSLRYQKSMWSIGIYTGDTFTDLHGPPGINNPVLTCESVSDVPATFVADPFMVRHAGNWHMFFEVMNRQTGKGEIGLATSVDGFAWSYQRIVLAEPFHLSYPYVFEFNNEHYMVPETLGAGAVCLYQADSFPTSWRIVGRLFDGSYSDPSLFQYHERWWAFVCATPYQHDTLRLYSAAELLGPWQEHMLSPIVQGNRHNARPGGRVLVMAERVVRFAQDCVPSYGSQLRAFEISQLTPDSYLESELPQSPILTASGIGWNAQGMHHIDPQRLPDGRWLACVDGLSAASET
jgi:hypothetical protein